MNNYLHITPDAIKELCPNNHDVIIEILECFSQNILDEVEQVQIAIDTLSNDKIKQAAHKVKTSFKMLGEEKASSLCFELEHSQNMPLQQRVTLLTQIKTLTNEITKEALQLISELKNVKMLKCY